MHKLFIAITGSGIVLMSGLVSCSQEKKTPDVYNAPTPVLSTENGNVSLDAWAKLSERRLDLQDRFDATSAKPSSLVASADCSQGEKKSSRKTAFLNAAIRIWQMLPYEIYSLALAQEKVTCSIRVSMMNETGSLHIIEIKPFDLVDMRDWPATFENSGTLTEDKPFVASRVTGTRVRYASAASGGARLLCEDVQTNPAPFDDVMDLGNLNFIALAPLKGRSKFAIQQRPLQNCRVEILENGRQVALTKLHKFYFPQRKLETKPLASKFNIFEGQPATLGAWRIQNPSDVERILQIPVRALTNQMTVTAWSPTSGSRFSIPVQATYIETETNEGLAANGQIKVKLSAGSSLDLFARLKGSLKGECPQAEAILGVEVRNTEAFQIEVLTEHGFKMESLTLQTPDQVMNRNTNPPNPSAYPWTCRWY